MVDAIVSFAVERLGDFLIREAVLLREVKDEVEWLKNELRWMQSFLRDAEEKQDRDERIRVWISEIVEIASSAEDLIDTFILKTKGTDDTLKLTKFMKSCSCISEKAEIYNIGKEIESLKKKVIDISRKKDVYCINNIYSAQEGASTGAIGRSRDLRRTTSYVDEEHFVGFEDDTSLLDAKLFCAEPQRSVISILGMGGLGKTTIARKLYNNKKHMFRYYAWICVSQEWKTRDLLERIIKSFTKLSKDDLEMLENMNDEDLERHLRDVLKGHRYLVVIDDVWHRDAWEILRRALPDNKNHSRIIITTRISDVAELLDERTYVHQLRFLRPDESWELFCKKAFPDHNASYPPSLEILGREMVTKCDGLPLAIVVLGGLLSRKQPHEWPTVKERIWRELKKNSIHISLLLDLSFMDLPHQLKLCFLYLGLFPEDFVIDAEKLIRLWMAEGFISQGEDKLNMEEVAEDYLKELISRSLIQVAKCNWRTVTACRVHDLLRDLAIGKARELNFLHIYYGNCNSAQPSPASTYIRRLSVHSKFENHVLIDHSVRTLLFFSDEMSKFVQLITPKLKLLTVLDLGGLIYSHQRSCLGCLDAVGRLIHLRYLGLERGMYELPKSVGNLQALQTLNARLCTVPRDICKLKQLRHLIGHFQGPFFAFEDLTNLQTFKVIEVGYSFREKSDEFALNPIAKLKNLKQLTVRSFGKILIQPLLHCQQLQELRIKGEIMNLPEDMHKFLPNLKHVELGESGLKQDPMRSLELLPKLIVLCLFNVGVDTLTCTATGFPQLEALSIVSDGLSFTVEEEAMPGLRALSLRGTISGTVPWRFQFLPKAPDLTCPW